MASKDNTPASVQGIVLPRIEYNEEAFNNINIELETQDSGYSPSFKLRNDRDNFHKLLQNNRIPFIYVSKSGTTYMSNREHRIRGIQYKLNLEWEGRDIDEIFAPRIKYMYAKLFEQNWREYDGIAIFELFQDILQIIAKFRHIRHEDYQTDFEDTQPTEEVGGSAKTFQTQLNQLIMEFNLLPDNEKQQLDKRTRAFFEGAKLPEDDLSLHFQSQLRF